MTTNWDVVKDAVNTDTIGQLTQDQQQLYKEGVRRGELKMAPTQQGAMDRIPVPVPKFDSMGTGYDYDTAAKYGIKPSPINGHWQSRVPETGQILKGVNHPTFHKTVEAERKIGNNIMYDETGKLYSIDRAGLREDGTMRGVGWLGRKEMKDGSGRVFTDMTVQGGLKVDGLSRKYPLLVPTLNDAEVEILMRGGAIPDSIRNKAIKHAKDRIENGMSPFSATTGPSKVFSPFYAYEELSNDKPKTGGYLSALFRGLGEGISTEFPAMGGRALQMVGLKKIGKAIVDWSDDVSDKLWGTRPEYEGFANWLYLAGTMIPSSVIPGAISMTGAKILMKMSMRHKVFIKGLEAVTKLKHAPGWKGAVYAQKGSFARGLKIDQYRKVHKAFSLARKDFNKASKAVNWITGASVGTFFGLSQAQSTKDTMWERIHMLEEQGDIEGANALRRKLWWAPLATGLIEGIGESIGAAYLAKIFRIKAGAVTKRGATKMVENFILNMGKTMGVEVGTEIGQAGGQAAVEKYAGVRPEARIMAEMVSVIGPTAVMTLLLGGASGAVNIPGMRRQIKENEMKGLMEHDRVNHRSNMGRFNETIQGAFAALVDVNVLHAKGELDKKPDDGAEETAVKAQALQDRDVAVGDAMKLIGQSASNITTNSKQNTSKYRTELKGIENVEDKTRKEIEGDLDNVRRAVQSLKGYDVTPAQKKQLETAVGNVATSLGTFDNTVGAELITEVAEVAKGNTGVGGFVKKVAGKLIKSKKVTSGEGLTADQQEAKHFTPQEKGTPEEKVTSGEGLTADQQTVSDKKAEKIIAKETKGNKKATLKNLSREDTTPEERAEQFERLKTQTGQRNIGFINRDNKTPAATSGGIVVNETDSNTDIGKKFFAAEILRFIANGGNNMMVQRILGDVFSKKELSQLSADKPFTIEEIDKIIKELGPGGKLHLLVENNDGTLHRRLGFTDEKGNEIKAQKTYDDLSKNIEFISKPQTSPDEVNLVDVIRNINSQSSHTLRRILITLETNNVIDNWENWYAKLNEVGLREKTKKSNTALTEGEITDLLNSWGKGTRTATIRTKRTRVKKYVNKHESNVEIERLRKLDGKSMWTQDLIDIMNSIIGEKGTVTNRRKLRNSLYTLHDYMVRHPDESAGIMHGVVFGAGREANLSGQPDGRILALTAFFKRVFLEVAGDGENPVLTMTGSGKKMSRTNPQVWGETQAMRAVAKIMGADEQALESYVKILGTQGSPTEMQAEIDKMAEPAAVQVLDRMLNEEVDKTLKEYNKFSDSDTSLEKQLALINYIEALRVRLWVETGKGTSMRDFEERWLEHDSFSGNHVHVFYGKVRWRTAKNSMNPLIKNTYDMYTSALQAYFQIWGDKKTQAIEDGLVWDDKRGLPVMMFVHFFKEGVEGATKNNFGNVVVSDDTVKTNKLKSKKATTQVNIAKAKQVLGDGNKARASYMPADIRAEIVDKYLYRAYRELYPDLSKAQISEKMKDIDLNTFRHYGINKALRENEPVEYIEKRVGHIILVKNYLSVLFQTGNEEIRYDNDAALVGNEGTPGISVGKERAVELVLNKHWHFTSMGNVRGVTGGLPDNNTKIYALSLIEGVSGWYMYLRPSDTATTKLDGKDINGEWWLAKVEGGTVTKYSLWKTKQERITAAIAFGEIAGILAKKGITPTPISDVNKGEKTAAEINNTENEKANESPENAARSKNYDTVSEEINRLSAGMVSIGAKPGVKDGTTLNEEQTLQRDKEREEVGGLVTNIINIITFSAGRRDITKKDINKIKKDVTKILKLAGKSTYDTNVSPYIDINMIIDKLNDAREGKVGKGKGEGYYSLIPAEDTTGLSNIQKRKLPGWQPKVGQMDRYVNIATELGLSPKEYRDLMNEKRVLTPESFEKIRPRLRQLATDLGVRVDSINFIDAPISLKQHLRNENPGASNAEIDAIMKRALMNQGVLKEGVVNEAIRNKEDFNIAGKYEAMANGQAALTLGHGATVKTALEEIFHAFIQQGGEVKGVAEDVVIGIPASEERAAKALADWMYNGLKKDGNYARMIKRVKKKAVGVAIIRENMVKVLYDLKANKNIDPKGKKLTSRDENVTGEVVKVEGEIVNENLNPWKGIENIPDSVYDKTVNTVEDIITEGGLAITKKQVEVKSVKQLSSDGGVITPSIEEITAVSQKLADEAEATEKDYDKLHELFMEQGLRNSTFTSKIKNRWVRGFFEFWNALTSLGDYEYAMLARMKFKAQLSMAERMENEVKRVWKGLEKKHRNDPQWDIIKDDVFDFISNNRETSAFNTSLIRDINTNVMAEVEFREKIIKLYYAKETIENSLLKLRNEQQAISKKADPGSIKAFNIKEKIGYAEARLKDVMENIKELGKPSTPDSRSADIGIEWGENRKPEDMKLDDIKKILDKKMLILEKLMFKAEQQALAEFGTRIPQDVKIYAVQAKELQKKFGKMLLERGIIGLRTYWKFHGSYIHYMYKKDMVLKGRHKIGVAAKDEAGIKEGWLEKRKILDEQLQDAYGLVKDLSVPLSVGMSSTLRKLAEFDYYEGLKKSPELILNLKGLKGVKKAKNGEYIVTLKTKPGFREWWEKKFMTRKPHMMMTTIKGEKTDELNISPMLLAESITVTHDLRKDALKNGNVKEAEAMEEYLKILEEAYQPIAARLTEVGDKILQLDYVVMGGKSNLKGEYVSKPVYNDITPIMIRDEMEKGSIYGTSLRGLSNSIMLFKIGKATLNFPTLVRNIISNVLQNNLRGRPLGVAMDDLRKSLSGFVRKGKDGVYNGRGVDMAFVLTEGGGTVEINLLREFLSEAGDQGTQITEEILPLIAKYETFYGGIGGRSWYTFVANLSRFSKYYGFVDVIAKYSIYRQLRTSGKLNKWTGLGTNEYISPEMAMQEAQKWGMDYSLTDPSIKHLRKFLTPFITFQYKAASLVVESLIRRPWVMAKYGLLLGVAGPAGWSLARAVAQSFMGMDDDEWRRTVKKLAHYIRREKTFLPIPWKNNRGEVMFFDASYFMPWGTWYNCVFDLKDGELAMSMRHLGVGNPFLTAYAALSSVVKGEPAIDPFTHQPIWNITDSHGEKWNKIASYMENLLMPGMFENWHVPGATKYGVIPQSARVIYSKLTGDKLKDKWGRVQGWEQLNKFFGVNLMTGSKQQVRAIRDARIKRIRAQASKKLYTPYWGENRARKRAIIRRRDAMIEEIKEEYKAKITPMFPA